VKNTYYYLNSNILKIESRQGFVSSYLTTASALLTVVSLEFIESISSCLFLEGNLKIVDNCVQMLIRGHVTDSAGFHERRVNGAEY
jgi:hypothetical protein